MKSTRKHILVLLGLSAVFMGLALQKNPGLLHDTFNTKKTIGTVAEIIDSNISPGDNPAKVSVGTFVKHYAPRVEFTLPDGKKQSVFGEFKSKEEMPALNSTLEVIYDPAATDHAKINTLPTEWLYTSLFVLGCSFACWLCYFLYQRFIRLE